MGTNGKQTGRYDGILLMLIIGCYTAQDEMCLNDKNLLYNGNRSLM